MTMLLLRKLYMNFIIGGSFMPQACLHGYKFISRYMALWVNACTYIIERTERTPNIFLISANFILLLIAVFNSGFFTSISLSQNLQKSSTIAQEQWNKNSNSVGAAAASSSSSSSLTFVTHCLPSCNLFPVTLLLFVSRQFFACFFCLFFSIL
ncbi:hypothetical protein ACKWTF_009820 [Chironomus riparius]